MAMTYEILKELEGTSYRERSKLAERVAKAFGSKATSPDDVLQTYASRWREHIELRIEWIVDDSIEGKSRAELLKEELKFIAPNTLWPRDKKSK